MNCNKPISIAGGKYPCGVCLPCRINNRRMWAHRIQLEALAHDASAFITLTVSDEHMKRTPDGTPTLEPKQTSGWLKRYRKSIEPTRVRYFLVGEYGDDTRRPHYHLALFGGGKCHHGKSRYNLRRQNCCPFCDNVLSTWGAGQILCGDLTEHSAQYIAGYTVKKLTSRYDERLSPQQHPEFSRQSRRPGIGYNVIPALAEQVKQLGTQNWEGDVPVALRHGSKQLPLGRYLRNKLRKEIFGHENAPPLTSREFAESSRGQKMLALSLRQAENKDYADEIGQAERDQALSHLKYREHLWKTKRDL